MKTAEEKLDQINERLHSIDKTLAINTQHLAEHMARTKQIERELAPVVKHVAQVQGAGKLLFIMSLIATITSVVVLLVR